MVTIRVEEFANKFFAGKARKRGLAPGTPVHIGERRVDRSVISTIRYSSDQHDAVSDCALSDLPGPTPGTVVWVDVTGLHDLDLVHSVCERFGIHPLTEADIVNTSQRAKFEEYEDYLYVVAKMAHAETDQEPFFMEQVSLVFGRGFVLTFQEQPGDAFDPIRSRIAAAKGRVRSMPASYLASALLSGIIEEYFIILEQFSDQVELLEDQVLEQSKPEVDQRIYRMRRETGLLRRAVWPLREAALNLSRTELDLIEPQTQAYFRDVSDHVVDAAETLELLRDSLTELLNLHLTTVSNRTNQVMKVLTIVATIFIPLTFIAGVYGMNFEFMPETHYPWAYFACLGFMAVAGLAMAGYFWKKGWF